MTNSFSVDQFNNHWYTDDSQRQVMYNYIFDHSLDKPNDYILHMLCVTPVYQQDTIPNTPTIETLGDGIRMHDRTQWFLYLLHRLGVRPPL